MPVHSHGYPAFVVDMESSECASAEDTDAEQLAAAHCTTWQQNGGGRVFDTAKAELYIYIWLRRAAKRNATELRRVVKSTQLQSLRTYQVHFDHQTFVNFHIIASPFLQILETLMLPHLWRNL